MITADAMHCQRETAQMIWDRGGHYVLTVKNNQPTLRRKLKLISWKDIPILDTSTEHGHGRRDTRTIKATELAEGIGFPGPARRCARAGHAPAARTGKQTRETGVRNYQPHARRSETPPDRNTVARALVDREPGALGP